jgi:hypothetical protein
MKSVIEKMWRLLAGDGCLPVINFVLAKHERKRELELITC